MNKQELVLDNSFEIAILHESAFANFFLTSLGQPFLKVFYESVLSHSNGVGVGFFENENLIGFAVGTTKKAGFYTSIAKKNSIKLLVACAPVLIKSPSKIIRLANALRKSNLDNEFDEEATLLSICINPDYSNRGVGSALLSYFEDKVFLSAESISLTTDAIDNAKANAFYTSAKYQFIKSFIQGKRKMNLYIKNKND